jgi:hypothetical protein
MEGPSAVAIARFIPSSGSSIETVAISWAADSRPRGTSSKQPNNTDQKNRAIVENGPVMRREGHDRPPNCDQKAAFSMTAESSKTDRSHAAPRGSQPPPAFQVTEWPIEWLCCRASFCTARAFGSNHIFTDIRSK